jgi:hypothetical protein
MGAITSIHPERIRETVPSKSKIPMRAFFAERLGEAVRPSAAIVPYRAFVKFAIIVL